MNSAEAFKQKVNFYVSVSFIFVFGLFLTTTVVQAINRDATNLKYFSPSYELAQTQ